MTYTCACLFEHSLIAYTDVKNKHRLSLICHVGMMCNVIRWGGGGGSGDLVVHAALPHTHAFFSWLSKWAQMKL